jgi:glutaminase
MNTNTKPFCSSPILDFLEQIHRELAAVTDGDVATYIPELAKANPNWFGICVVTNTGHIYEVGDTRQNFTIQSISKPFVYGLALEDNGRSQVLAKVGMEPTGDAFNSISLEPGTGRPRNPMINAGAIATASLIAGKSGPAKLRRLLETFALYAGRELSLDEAVYRSESETGHRNRAIGHMLRNFDILTADPNPVVELYFQQCSISVNARDLGIMAATLANQGLNPISGKQAIRGEYVESVLSVMGSCGMYDYAGEWIYKIGMPAKSGVAGGIIAVLPGQLGIGVFSPPLDAHGNSVRGIGVCDALSRHWDLHMLNRPGVGNSAIRSKFTGADVKSNRIRTLEESVVLSEFGVGITVYQLQGNLTFTTTEAVVRDVVEGVESIKHLIFDFKRVLTINESAGWLFYEVLKKFSDAGKSVVFTQANHLPSLLRLMKAKLKSRYDERFRSFEDNDLALEWCENRIIQIALPERVADRMAIPEQYELLENLALAEVAHIVSLLKRQTHQPGETIINTGDKGDKLFFLVKGSASVFVPAASGTRKRLATFSSSMVFGEIAVIDRSSRTATIIADSEVVCDVLRLEDFEGLGTTHPEIKIKLLKNLVLCLCRRMRERKLDGPD